MNELFNIIQVVISWAVVLAGGLGLLALLLWGIVTLLNYVCRRLYVIPYIVVFIMLFGIKRFMVAEMECMLQRHIKLRKEREDKTVQ